MFSHTLGASLYRTSRRTDASTRDFSTISADRAPTVHRLREHLSRAASDEDQLLRALVRLTEVDADG